MRRFAAAATMLAISLFAAGCATTPEVDPIAVKMNDLDRRLERIEKVMANQSLLDLAAEVQKLQAELRSMRGQLEELQNAAETGRNQQRDLYADLDRRIQSLESGAAPAPAETAASAGLPIPGGSDRSNYQAAFDLLKNGQYEKATAAFQQFLTSFPDSALADNGQYWLGESYYVTRDFNNALAAFRQVVEKYPQSRKLPDAWLKIGYCHYELKAWAPAREALNRVVRGFPDSSAAQEAAGRLARIAAEGH